MVAGKNRGHGNIPEDHPPDMSGKDINALLQEFGNFMTKETSQPRVPVMHPEEEPNVCHIYDNKFLNTGLGPVVQS